MSLHALSQELDEVTRQLRTSTSEDAQTLESALARRATLIDRIAAAPPTSFTSDDLNSLRAALQGGDDVRETLVLTQRRVAAEWLRLNHMRQSTSTPAASALDFSA